MALKLTVGREDKILMSNGVVIDVLSLSRRNGGEVTLAFDAPREIEIHTVFKDSSKQFKNLKPKT
jgi:sRNA-binding carbon storage regulator CsrA